MLLNEPHDVFDRSHIESGHALDALLPQIYRDLRALAARLLAGEPAATLQPTELVHDALIRLMGQDVLRVADRKHFFRLFALLMRHLLVDRARRAGTSKHGADWEKIDVLEAMDLPLSRASDIEQLNVALEDLEQVEPLLGRIVEMRYFTGLTMKEIAQALEVDERTVYRNWAVARAWLRRQISDP